MKTYCRAALGMATVLVLAAVPALAHHSQAMFDRTKTVDVAGTVREFHFNNPHVLLEVDVPGADGKVTIWSFESSGIMELMRVGVKRSSLQPGEKVVVKASPLKDGRPGGSLIEVMKADGTIVGRRQGP
jgi:Family of unknown function (DUF6152)